MSNFNVVQPFSNEPAGIVALNCAGSIVLEDWYVRGKTADLYMHFENCADVTVRGAEIYMSGRPVTAVDSQLLISDSSLSYDPPQGIFWPFYSYLETTETLRLVDATATIVASGIFGIGQIEPAIFELWERPAVVPDNSILNVGPLSALRGGSNGSTRYPGYQVFTTASVNVDPRATITSNGIGTTQTNDYAHAVYHTSLVAGEPYTLAVSGPPGGFAVIASGDDLSSPLPTVLGELSLLPSSVVVTGLLALTATNGYHQQLLTCPAMAPVGHAFAFQAATLAPDGTLALTIPSPFTVGWPHGQTP
ncbi:MAG: hypothetical protein AB8H80_23850 [Planctomycetota bacterium]